MSHLAGGKLVPSENSLEIRSNWVISMADFVWNKRNLLLSRSLVLPVERFRAVMFSLVYAVKTVVSGVIQDLQKLSGNDRGNDGSPRGSFEFGNAEKIVGVFVVSHLVLEIQINRDPAVAEIQRMRNQLEYLQAELLCYRAGGVSSDEVQVLKHKISWLEASNAELRQEL